MALRLIRLKVNACILSITVVDWHVLDLTLHGSLNCGVRTALTIQRRVMKKHLTSDHFGAPYMLHAGGTEAIFIKVV